MAGTLDDLPGERLRFDVDGSYAVGYRENNSVPVDVTAETSVLLSPSMHEFIDLRDSRFVGSGRAFVALVFPEERTLAGIWGWSEDATLMSLQYSLNTTDGVDGTWTTISSSLYIGGTYSSRWRTQIRHMSPAVPNVRGVRWSSYQARRLHTMHLYVQPVTTVSDRLAFWNSTTNVALPVNTFDFGDITRDTYSPSRAFRIKNLSSSKTATDLAITARNDTAVLTSAFEDIELSLDDTTWIPAGTPLPLGTIGAGNFSPIIYVRVKTSLDGIYSPKTALLTTSFSSFA